MPLEGERESCSRERGRVRHPLRSRDGHGQVLDVDALARAPATPSSHGRPEAAGADAPTVNLPTEAAPESTPEPASLSLMGAGVAGLLLRRKRS